MRRDKENVGKTTHSWFKQGMFAINAQAQAFTFRVRNPRARMLLIDANSGDGIGVPKPYDLFHNEDIADSTAGMLADLARVTRADLALCEKMKSRRLTLMHRFKDVIVLAKHEDIPEHVRANAYDYILWVSDTCGYSQHGLPQMREVASLCKNTDFIVALNVGALTRLLGVSPKNPFWRIHHAKWHPEKMIDPLWWRNTLGKRYVAASKIFHQSSNFNFQILVLSNNLSLASRQPPFSIIKDNR